ncbi:MAG: helix-turn-helix transcriptional regulator [Clostridiaceae bacterium]|nr:helix-turn-helix transcriptional regulator [Clostridiaceae bacterium]
MLGSNVKRIMELRGISAKDLAMKLDISPTYLSYVMNDKRKPSFDMLEKLAEALNVSLADLVREEKIAKLDKKLFSQKEGFDHFVKQQLLLLGYEVVYKPEDNYLYLVGQEGTFEISMNQLEDLTNNIKSYLNFKVHELMTASKKINIKPKYELRAAHNDDVSEEERQLMEQDLDDL